MRLWKKVGGDLLSRGCAVPSARLGLTSLFGMGRGDPQRYNHQNIVWTTQSELAKLSCKQHWLQLLLQQCILLHAPLIVPTLSRHAPCGGGGCKFRAISKARLWHRCLYTCLLSTSSSLTTLMRKSNLVAGFALRCFQRLSDPDMDTQRCAWRHNW